MRDHAPWLDPAWRERAGAETLAALTAAGRPPTAPIEPVKAWGRSCVQRVATAEGIVWIKHAYRLPPGEEVVLERLARRWPQRLPRIVATWPGAVAMEPLPGRELGVDAALSDWTAAARALAEIAAGEVPHAGEWLALGVRDRRPPAWQPAVAELLESAALDELEPELRVRFEELVPEFVARYERAFTETPTLVHQDSGCCNVHVGEEEPVIFDWSDVVVGDPVFSCDRLLDQVPAERRDAVIAAFLEPLGTSREAFDAMRRSNVLHEVLRYHDELEWLSPDDPVHASLARSVRSQLRVLVEHESRARD